MKRSEENKGSVTHSRANTSPLESDRQLLSRKVLNEIFKKGTPSGKDLGEKDGGFIDGLGNEGKDGSSKTR